MSSSRDPLTRREVLNAALRADLGLFAQRVFTTINPGERYCHNWHIDAMAHALDAIRRGETTRLLITVPPRHMKSLLVSVAFPAWMLGQDPSLKFLVASYGGDLAAKHARDFRTVLESAWYQGLYPGTRLKRSTEAEVATTRGGGRKAVSVGGSATGFGADIIIVDDVLKAADASSAAMREEVKSFYRETLLTRLNDKRSGRVVAIQQRLHEDDLAGYMLESKTFHCLNLPAIAEADEAIPIGFDRRFVRKRGEALFPAREPLEVLEKLRRELGGPAFSAQYQQTPVGPESSYLRWSKISTYDASPDRYQLERVVQSWDTSTTSNPGSDYSVCTTWGYYASSWLLLDLYRKKLDYPELLAAVRRLRDHWRADVVLIENASSGIPLLQTLRAEQREGRRSHPWMRMAYEPRVDKLTRFSAQVEKLESGFARLPAQAPWLFELKRELVGFPHTRYDDQVDSLSQFLDWAGGNPRAAPRREAASTGMRRARTREPVQALLERAVRD